ncbi:hypothetical protein M472_02415 [Sphingobacterium paucimobilis HER1398]|uniref:Thioredoxin domain-containing protein n=2 Tax=Sphingobacterium TaxID=28453 RepID=U2HQ77_9SPHI|nr:hypothetical protein M472_02415 [Sphingobacterium paucimobilis HER1398]
MGSAQTAKFFQLEGTVPREFKEIILLYYDYNTDDTHLDSTIVEDGKFVFKGSLEGAAYAGLYFKETSEQHNRNACPEFWFYLNAGKTIVDASGGVERGKIVGGDILTQQYLAYEEKLERDKNVFESSTYQKELQKMETLRLELLKAETNLKQIYGVREDLFFNNKISFIKQYPDNPLSLLYLEYVAGQDNNEVDIKALYAGLSDELKKSVRGQKLGLRFQAEILVPGENAFDFAQPDANGKLIKLSDFRGKYVLLDFWASWCVPCRNENPNVLKAYDRFHDKNFEILAVSLDNEKENWLKAIEEDKLPWYHVSDLKGWQNAASTLYAIRGIPANYLIDPQGKIIAQNLRGNELEEKLAEVLK